MGRLNQLGIISIVALQISVLVLLPRLLLTRMEVILKSLKLIRSKLIRVCLVNNFRSLFQSYEDSIKKDKNDIILLIQSL